jgi:ABC-type branched-subunit amino acid transport system permease subunit
MDNAGLEEPVQAVRFSVDTGILSPTGPFGPWVLVLLVAIVAAFLALLVGFALWRRKRKEEPEAAPPPEAPEQ